MSSGRRTRYVLISSPGRSIRLALRVGPVLIRCVPLRDNSTNADIVLLPYNYLVDASIRATLKIAWENSVVIFDEAHNLESV